MAVSSVAITGHSCCLEKVAQKLQQPCLCSTGSPRPPTRTHLSVEVQEATGAVDIVEGCKGVDRTVDPHRVQPQGPPACHQEPVG